MEPEESQDRPEDQRPRSLCRNRFELDPQRCSQKSAGSYRHQESLRLRRLRFLHGAHGRGGCLLLLHLGGGGSRKRHHHHRRPWKQRSLHPLQKSFALSYAAQCGWCTPGMILSAKALLDRNPNPSEAEVRVALSGVLCRCTGYTSIVQAVLDAAGLMRETMSAELLTVGQSVPRFMELKRRRALCAFPLT